MSNETPETISPRDLSYQQAVAGNAAIELATAAGADPADLKAIRHSINPPITEIRGKTLHGFGLQVILNLQVAAVLFGGDLMVALSPTVQRLFGGDPTLAPDELRLIARLGFIFSDPAEASEYLEDAAEAVGDEEKKDRLRAFTRAAMRECGEWNGDEIAALFRHLITLGKLGAAEIPPTA